MNYSDYQQLKHRFTLYTDSFKDNDTEKLPYPLQLKVDHSHRVADDSRLLAEHMHYSPNDKTIAIACGLIHDIGRFEQYRQYQSFVDRTSVDHGECGFEALEENNILQGIDPAEALIIRNGVRYHNKKMIPETIESNSIPWLHLLRDADKLDIFFIVKDLIINERFKEYQQLVAPIDFDAPPSPEVLHDLTDRQFVSYNHIKSLPDIFLLLLSWIHDLHYPASLQILKERSIIGFISERLKPFPETQEHIGRTLEYIKNRID